MADYQNGYDDEFERSYSQPKRKTEYNLPFLPGEQQPAPEPQKQQYNPANYEQARDDWMGGGYDVGNTDAARASAQQWSQKWGIPVNGDTADLGAGGQIDIIGNFAGGAGNGRALARNWTPAGGNGPNPGGGGASYGGFGPSGNIGASLAMARSVYTPGQLPTAGLKTYTPGTLSQFQAPDQSGMNSVQNQALTSALQSGGSLNPGVVAQMKGRLQEQGAGMLQQQLGRNAQSAAQRGVPMGGGEEVQARRSSDALNAALLGGYRDIDVAAAGQNFNDILGASGAMNESLGRQAGTAQNFYNTGLGGQLAQEGLNERGVTSQNAAVNYDLQRALAQEGLAQSAAGLNEGGREFDIGQELARAQMAQQNSQFGQSLGEQGRQFNMGYGLDFERLRQQRERDYLDRLLGGQ